MAVDVEASVVRLMRNYRLGAICESIFYGCLIEVADHCPPEQLWAALPEDAREGLRAAVLLEVEWAQDGGLTSTPGYRRLHAWLSAGDVNA